MSAGAPAGPGGLLGYQVDPASLLAEAATLRGVGDQLTAVSGELQSLPAVSDEAVGEPRAAQAYRSFLANSGPEFTTQAGALNEAAGKISMCTTRYQHGEDRSVAAIQGVFGPFGPVGRALEDQTFFHPPARGPHG